MEKMLVKGVAKDNNVARLSIIGVQDVPGIAFKIFSTLASKKVNVDIILQSVGRHNTKDIAFTVSGDQKEEAMEVLASLSQLMNAQEIVCDDNICKVSIVGAGMATNPGVAAKMFEALADAGVNIQMISTSEIKISVLIRKEDCQRAVAAVHDAFIE